MSYEKLHFYDSVVLIFKSTIKKKKILHSMQYFLHQKLNIFFFKKLVKNSPAFLRYGQFLHSATK